MFSDSLRQSYVELDQWSLFQANESITITDRESGRTTDLLDMSRYAEVCDRGVRDLQSFFYMAIHHSLDGRHVIAVGNHGELLWFRRYREQSDDVEQRYQNVVVLRPEAWNGNEFDNLCLENDRGANNFLH